MILNRKLYENNSYLRIFTTAMKNFSKLLAHRVFKKALHLEFQEMRQKQGAPYLTTDIAGAVRCISCNLCVEICPTDALELNKEKQFTLGDRPSSFKLKSTLCTYCRYCEEVCPEDAIALAKTRDNDLAEEVDLLATVKR